ncbi:MAG TPA: exodeoxyribonuclease VII large subunit [Gammaproteobacteria bacterium]|nr:exodeoxyribonuclease VII large subunit [Gammaproteobacteria bacterium]HJL80164.1 exodeoxyribonuclease VII large subunit [Gammaproteobacteria bacterium]HJN00397.1 exodeoxyribonuclease VII large subunit [Gammaproteobacteria bacterium]|tara:strand:- start:44637 stop:45986 length:1350 start_codon:yes stop_codon:yes gene_type:complete
MEPFDSQEHIYTISELNDEVASTLTQTFGVIWVEGEVSNLMRSAAGHVYFSLKDESASVRCAMFRMQNQSLDFSLKDGMQILARAKVGLYKQRGEFQLIVEYAEESGEGLLRQKFELLKQTLLKEGLFDEEHKLPLPEIPETIGLITSPKGAAVQDILKTIKRRYSLVNVIVYPTLVQGNEATQQIASAIDDANERKECDVLIVARGGGSLEDLWCFNEELVARSIFNSRIPIISGIGHETDFTITDLVADLRAATPTAAAEIALPSINEIMDQLNRFIFDMNQLADRKITDFKHRLKSSSLRMQASHPHSKLQLNLQKLDLIDEKMRNLPMMQLKDLTNIFRISLSKLLASNPKNNIETEKQNLEIKKMAFLNALMGIIESKKNRFSILTTQLESASPLQLLNRGYAVVTTKDDKSIKSIRNISPGASVKTKLSDGSFMSKVERIDKD